MFVDRVRVNLRAGNGGAGVVSFVRTKGKPKGRPNGGNGGPGGSVILRADPSVATLLRYHRNPHHQADSGTHGEGDLRHGRGGEDLVLPVPLGTTVIDEDGTTIADLVEEGEEVLAVAGGRGGRGNAAFVNPGNRAPAIAEQGEYGRSAWFILEMKLLADAALVGFPNAGKSTFISRVSAAKPKIADYPFTTLEPNLGVVSFDGREFVLADIPGLIEGASGGKGLGHEFLRHTERARVLVYLLDPSPLQEASPREQLEILRREVADYSDELSERPSLVVLNKSDLPEAEPVGEALQVSALTGEGLKEALHAIADLAEQAEKQAPERVGFVLHRPLGPEFKVAKDGDVWVVSGIAAERAVSFADLTVAEAADMAARRLARIGVDEALREAGAEEGDEVRIGDLSFEFLVGYDEEE
ncbi:MAG: GTPase ObgE [Actinobacteria bacterium]|nr:MAG: GTPase ObgE [Actinomycetota bacterium]REK40635.1 MAG: GTPase ObgE [Actinomycetota bacterium]